MPDPLIALTTDFAEDYFTGVMKGVIARINPAARVIDVTDTVAPGDLRSGAFVLMAACGYFPDGTIHVVVVDPGVGSARRILCAETARYTFIAPDNGILSWVLRRETPRVVRSIENADYFLDHVSCTFHGRDVFAPVAAHLTLGVKPGELGPEIAVGDMVHIDFPEVRRGKTGELSGEVLYVDRFGNCITNIAAEDVDGTPPRDVRVEAGALSITGLKTTYADVSPGSVLALIGSSGYLEIATSGGSAQQRFGLKPGDPVVVGKA